MVTVTRTGTPPVTLLSAKQHLRITPSDISYDEHVKSLIEVSTSWVENETRSMLTPSTLLYTFDAYDLTGRSFRVPRPPLIEVTTFKYADGNNWLDVDPASYTVDPDSRPGRILLNDGYSWPTTNRFRLEFKAGYTKLPSPLRHAILLLVGHFFENTEAVAGTSLAEMPLGIRSLVGQYAFPEATR